MGFLFDDDPVFKGEGQGPVPHRSKSYSRGEYLTLMRGLLNEMEKDHEDHTGIADTERMTFGQWNDEIEALYRNTRD